MFDINLVKTAAGIKRYHTVDGIEDTVGHHSHGVACLCLYLTDNAASAALLRAALLHDVEEIFTGDIPAQVKWQNPGLNEELDIIINQRLEENDLVVLLSKQELHILKNADILDLIMCCDIHADRGVRIAAELMWRGLDYLNEEIGLVNDRARDLSDKFVAQAQHYDRRFMTFKGLPDKLKMKAI